MSFQISDVFFDYVPAEHLDAAQDIEQHEYPADEAGTLEAFRYRQAHAPELFLGAYLGDQGSRKLIGYVCGTLSPDEHLTHHSMAHHIPNAPSVCIHSVCVSSTYQRKGVALALLKEYFTRLDNAKQEGKANYERVLLIAHDRLIGLYQKSGMELVGPSDVVHGPDAWYELRRDIPVKGQDQPTSLPPGLLDALRAPRRNVPSGRLLSDFPGGVLDVTIPENQKDDKLVNKFDLLCPRCSSIVLKAAVGRWVEKESVELEPSNVKNEYLPPLPTPPETVHWWLVTPSPMSFENAGFTRAVDGKRIKLLTCGECELGPIGYCEEIPRPTEFWVSCSRVAYRQ
ncbi:hypothetical protein CVT24_013173 [Panaeolus cyanescens]|uniref:N-acetyltransferase domain-containing protein n=1 Tax=Panaeolus cyanescens TaxID=181874 RepID=A0A409VW09_9AGAR|nr:hypothetical protein CVT24_013173 [Panaeolus cyanescens]